MKKIKECQFLNRSFEIEAVDTQYTEYDEICIEEVFIILLRMSRLKLIFSSSGVCMSATLRLSGS